MKQLRRYLKKFKKSKIMVIGDVMLDKYIQGKVERISPEAPVPVVEVEKVFHIPGGAANVANNISALAGGSTLVGVAGEDQAREILMMELKNRNIHPFFINEDRPTIEKVRVMGFNQQLIRLDFEKKSAILDSTRKKIFDYVTMVLPEMDCVVLSDYAKGMVTREFATELVRICNNQKKPVIVDPKPRNMKYFKDAYLVTPNHKEASQFAGIEEEKEEDINKIGKKILGQLNANLLITRGEKGMALFETNGHVSLIPTRAKQVFDVTGAGDTVISVVALGLSAGATLAESALIANYSAGIVVGKVGTATVSMEELTESLDKDGLY